MLNQMAKFIVVGVFSTSINYGAFYILYNFLSAHYIIASMLGFVIGVFAGYIFNKSWTFNIQEKSPQHIYKYYIVYTISLFFGLGFLKFLVTVMGLIPEIANLLTIGLTTCTNFTGIKFWVFNQ